MTGRAPDDSRKPDGGSPPPAPRWVKVAGVVALVLLVLFVLAMLTGGPGEHEPGRHAGLGHPTTAAPAA